MKFNHLIERHDLKTPCVENKEHYFVPTSQVESTFEHVAVRFRCKKCGKISTSFMTKEEYKIHQKLIEKFGGI
jgi:hypothetical protein